MPVLVRRAIAIGTLLEGDDVHKHSKLMVKFFHVLIVDRSGSRAACEQAMPLGRNSNELRSVEENNPTMTGARQDQPHDIPEFSGSLELIGRRLSRLINQTPRCFHGAPNHFMHVR